MRSHERRSAANIPVVMSDTPVLRRYRGITFLRSYKRKQRLFTKQIVQQRFGITDAGRRKICDLQQTLNSVRGNVNYTCSASIQTIQFRPNCK